jgi:Flp pilus assembly protein CpaB
MKQKNLILVAVAVGCGLVAAVLTSQMSAGTAPVVETQEVPVAAKELPMGTWLKKADLKTYVVYKRFPKDNLPAAFASSEEELGDKRTARLIRAGEPFNPADLTTNVSIQPPAGMNMMAIPISSDRAAAGFAVPGSRVDVVAAVNMQSLGGRGIIFPLLVDMLVLAVDTNAQANPQGGAMANVGMVSLAVTNDQVSMITAAIRRSSDLRIVLRNPERPPTWEHIPSKDEIWGIMADDPKRLFSAIGKEIKEEKKDDKLKLPVPKEDLPAGTQLTEAVLKDKFTTIEFTPPAPANILSDVNDLKDQYLASGIAANQFVPRAFLVPRPPHAKAAPTDDDAPRGKEALEQAQAPKAVAKAADTFHDVTVQSAGGIVTYRYKVQPDGEYKYVGPVRTGSPKPDEDKAKDEPAPAATDDEDDAPRKKPAAPKKPTPKKAGEPDDEADPDDAPAKKPGAKKKAG